MYDDPKGKLAQHKPTLLRAALEDMTKQGICLCVDAETGLYILTQPLVAYNQTVALSPVTASLIGDAFNLFARETGQEVTCNKLAITEAEVNCVVRVAFALHERVANLEDELEDIMGDFDEENGPGPGGPEGPPDDPSVN